MRSVTEAIREDIEPRLRLHGFTGSPKNAIRRSQAGQVVLVASVGGWRFNMGGKWGALTGVPPTFTLRFALYAGRELASSTRIPKTEVPIAASLPLPFQTDRFARFDALGIAPPAGSRAISEALTMIDAAVAEAAPLATIDDVWALVDGPRDAHLLPNEYGLLMLAAREKRVDICRRLVATTRGDATVLRRAAASLGIDV